MTVLPDILTDISVKYAPLPAALEGARGVLWQAAAGHFLLDVPVVARYFVEQGRSITIDTAPDAPAQKIEYFLGMLPLAAMLYQRGVLAFHAAAVTNGNMCVLLAGDSGSGKSTLLTMMLMRGWRMLADDLAIVGLDEKGQATVYPVRSGIALWPDSLNKLGIDFEFMPRCDANRREYSVAEQFEAAPQRLCSIYHLGVHSKRDVELKEIAGSARFNIIGTLLYNSHVADVLFNRVDYLRCASVVAQSVAFRELKRPRGVWSADQLADQISNTH